MGGAGAVRVTFGQQGEGVKGAGSGMSGEVPSRQRDSQDPAAEADGMREVTGVEAKRGNMCHTRRHRRDPGAHSE